jgi:uncharacterized membrane protein
MTSVQIVASFLLAFKSVLIEGTEITILSLATINLIGKRNVLLGLLTGLAGTVLSYLLVSRVFLFVSDQKSFFGMTSGGEIIINLVAGAITLFFSWRFLKEFFKYYKTRSSFAQAMKEEEDELVSKEKRALTDEHLVSVTNPKTIPISFRLSLPILTITLSEGFEASLVVSAATAYNQTYAILGVITSILILLVTSALAYSYLVRVQKWLLEGLAGTILLIFGLYFVASALLLL